MREDINAPFSFKGLPSISAYFSTETNKTQGGFSHIQQKTFEQNDRLWSQLAFTSIVDPEFLQKLQTTPLDLRTSLSPACKRELFQYVYELVASRANNDCKRYLAARNNYVTVPQAGSSELRVLNTYYAAVFHESTEIVAPIDCFCAVFSYYGDLANGTFRPIAIALCPKGIDVTVTVLTSKDQLVQLLYPDLRKTEHSRYWEGETLFTEHIVLRPERTLEDLMQHGPVTIAIVRMIIIDAGARRSAVRYILFHDPRLDTWQPSEMARQSLTIEALWQH